MICDPDYLMLDIVLPAGDPRIADDLAESYAGSPTGLLAALARRGARGLRAVSTAEVRGRRRGRTAWPAAWPAGPGSGPYELVDAAGRKLVGLAQRRRRGAALFQAAAYLGGTREPLADLLPADAATRADVRARLRNVGSLGELAPSIRDSPPKLW